MTCKILCWQIDFTKCGGLLFCLLIVLILFGFACIIVTVVSDPSDRTRRVSRTTGLMVRKATREDILHSHYSAGCDFFNYYSKVVI